MILWYSWYACNSTQKYRAIVDQYPDDLEAWEYLGYSYGMWGQLNGQINFAQEEIDAFERVLSLDPDYSTPYQQLIYCNMREKNISKVDSLLKLFHKY